MNIEIKKKYIYYISSSELTTRKTHLADDLGQQPNGRRLNWLSWPTANAHWLSFDALGKTRYKL